MTPLLAIAALAAPLAARPPVAPWPQAVATSRVSVRIVAPARVVNGRTSEPHSVAVLLVDEPDGSRKPLKLIEFP